MTATRSRVEEALRHGGSLSDADLTGADLHGAYLRGADLTGAYLEGADLTRADLTGANLTGADLSGADLSGADLHAAILTRADLSGASLRGTCLDPENTPNQGGADRFARILFGRLIGYRTRERLHIPGPDYQDGAEYRAPWFSTAEAMCHPGLYVVPEPSMVAEGHEIIRVTFRVEDLHRAGNKWRVKAFIVDCRVAA